MKKALFLLLALAMVSLSTFAQDLPKGLTPQERDILEDYFRERATYRGSGSVITTPPAVSSLRTMAEWEEIQALIMAWTSYPNILKEIARYAKEETEVVILSNNVNNTTNFLSTNTAIPALNNLNNVSVIPGQYNSVWIRDYAANTVYINGVDSLILVDWIYNRPRPLDDASPELIAAYLGYDLYATTVAPSDLVNTGGNFMSDGFGTGFASELILVENQPGNPYGVTSKTAEDIDVIKSDFMGIERFVKMVELPFDNISHIDMHMKLLDEETLLVGEYPDGIADGPQINANIEYILSNFESVYGTPYRIVRIPMPPNFNGTLWPSSSPPAHYRTYTNSVFVNKTIIIPTYFQQYDTTALRIYAEELPGYKLIPIDSDGNNPGEPSPFETIISASGAIHCITHSVGVADPLLIRHQRLRDTEEVNTDLQVEALIRHRSGIASAQLWFSTDTAAGYVAVQMGLSNAEEDTWIGLIPGQNGGTEVFYYIEATANSGKTQVRPMPAPAGYWKFRVLGEVSGIADVLTLQSLQNPFPNPANALTCVPVQLERPVQGSLRLVNALGQTVEEIHSGSFAAGDNRFFIQAQRYAPGMYMVMFTSGDYQVSRKLMIQP